MCFNEFYQGNNNFSYDIQTGKGIKIKIIPKNQPFSLKKWEKMIKKVLPNTHCHQVCNMKARKFNRFKYCDMVI